jgi:7-cyano-7-deazaguanine synthase in queuosine biosynthesis
MWGPQANVNFAFEDVRRAMFGDVPAAFLDLIDIAVYAYCADQAVPRGELTDRNFGEDWRRRLFFRIPVRHPELWNDPETTRLLVFVLSFLSEDQYDFQFEPLAEPPPSQNYFAFTEDYRGGRAEEMVLFSGGLDSLGGAIREVVTDRRRIVLVQHRPSPKGAPRQRALLRALQAKAGEGAPDLIAVCINKDRGLTQEFTQRTRSFLYAALAAALAEALGLPRIRFFENGVVSLNLPPSAQVVGARASRTTHPQALRAMSGLFARLAGHPFAVENPFHWLTKAQVIEGIAAAGCADLIRLTASCSHLRQAQSEVPHCGRCSQCIDRRFAVLAAGQGGADPASGYALDLLTGARAEGHPRTMLAVYVEMASQITRMTSLQFFARYGEAARVLWHVGESPETAAHRIFDLYKRHAQDVMKVVHDGIARFAPEIAERSLPPSCLIRLVCETSPAGGTPAPPPFPEPGPTGPLPDYLFRRKGAAWEFRFAGGQEQIMLPSRGAAYLHQLLSHPGVGIPAVRLAFNVIQDPSLFALGSAGEVLDEDALATYRATYEEWQEELERARKNNDLGAVEEIQGRIARLAQELEQNQAFRGRARRAADDRDRVRKAVGNALRRAVKQIRAYDKRFAEHLTPPRLTCGHTPCYQPGSDQIRWES